MLRRSIHLALILVATLLASVVTAQPASAITRTSTCASTNLKTISVTGNTCWNGWGTAWVTLYRVTRVYAGDRNATVYWTKDGRSGSDSIPAGWSMSYDSVTIHRIYRA